MSRTTARVVVVGGGIAGLTAALHARDRGAAVRVVTKGALIESNTRYAQGGIAAVTSAGDRIEDHVHDTLTAGAGLGDERAVRMLAHEAPERIAELVQLGVGFDRAADGTLARGLEAAHSAPRVLHAGGDATGLAIQTTLSARLRECGAEVIENASVVAVVLRAGRARGVDLVHADGRRERLDAEAVVLATGGAGQLFSHTTNPLVATGDGIALALRAGAEVADLEFVQFHPTVLAVGTPFLVSEAVRGEGAVLLDDAGRRFTFDDHPDGELAPRDVVARSIARRMNEQGGRPVLLDATALGGAFLARRFPTIDRAVRDRGQDWSETPVPVSPAAHYLMGGVVTDLHGRTRVPGLYAVGETARTGVHGANRLASNSLLEGAVFGARAGDAIAGDAASDLWPLSSGDSAPAALLAAPTADAAAFSRTALQQLMWAEAGLARGDGLERAASVVSRWRDEQRMLRTPTEHEDANLLLVAAHVVDAARRRRVSVGAHYRTDLTPSPVLIGAAAC